MTAVQTDLHENALAGLIEQGTPVVVLSPHLDDAVLSCGALMTYALSRTSVTVVTFFTAGGQAPYSRPARRYLRRTAIQAPVERVVVHRLRQAYPVYRRGYEKHFVTVDEWVGQLEGLLTLGRQGLFAHDNTHHTLAMAYAAADCLLPDGTFNWTGWADHRREFETHVVED